MQDMMSYSSMFLDNSFSSSNVDPGKMINMVLKNKKTGMIVEVQDISAYAAVKRLKWRPRHTVLLEKTPVVVQEEEKETNAL